VAPSCSDAIVVHADTAVGRAIVDGLRDCGIDVSAIPGAALQKRVDFDRAYAAVAGEVSTIVIPVLPGSPVGIACIDMTDTDWIAGCEQPLRLMRCAVQAARGRLPSGGRIVLIASTAALTGEAGITAYSVVSEGARALVRVVGRGWGQHGITLHWVGVPTALMTGTANLAGDAMWDHALGRLPDLRRDVAPAIAALSSTEMQFVTGTATVIDGGVIMLT
jgi:hypothetical protein